MLHTGERNAALLITYADTSGKDVAKVLRRLADFPDNSPIKTIRSKFPNIPDRYLVYHPDTVLDSKADIIIQQMLTPYIEPFSATWRRNGHFGIRVSDRIPDMFIVFNSAEDILDWAYENSWKHQLTLRLRLFTQTFSRGTQ